MKLIYENDCPTQEEALLRDIFGSYRGALYTGHRFKHDGITDNRIIWKWKTLGKGAILDFLFDYEDELRHDLTKSDMGFK